MISIDEFISKHGVTGPSVPILKLVEKWTIESDVDQLLKTQVGNGVFVADILMNPDIQHDGISNDLLKGFSGLMKEKANTYQKVHDYLMATARNGPEAFHGLRNKIQGQIGENQFAHHVGSHAHAARSGSQEAWDFVVHHPHGDQYVQVKVYESAAKAIAAVKEVNAKVAAGLVRGYDGIHVVKKIDFAVNDDIYQHVKDEVARQKLHISVQSIGASRSQIQASLNHADYRILLHGPLHNFFNDLFLGALVGTALIGAVNGYLLWTGAKGRDIAIEDTFYGAATTTGGVTSVLTTKALLGGFLGPAGFVTAVGIGMGSRAVLNRFFSRRHMVDRLIDGNVRLKELCSIGS